MVGGKRTKERRFFNALKNIFIGVPVEGESGYINLMRMKSKYFDRVMMPAIRKEVEETLKPFPDFREELFDKLYTFFKRYFTESGSIGFFFTPYHQSIYERIYTNEQDVVLFWKTARLYYVKTDRLFRSMTVEVDGFRFFFDASTLEHKRANEKRQLVFNFKERREDGTFVFTVSYSERGSKTKVNKIREAIKNALGLKRYTSAVPSEETLEKALRLFERQSEVDYFICKDAKSFLREQFDLWLWQYVLGSPGEEPQTEWTETRIRQLQALKRIAYKVIDFIAAFEDELVKIWNKPKFVLKSGYVITLDRIVERNKKLLERIVKHSGFAEQVKEWQELGMVDESFSAESLWERDITGKHPNPRYRFLPLDTKYFKDLELQIIGLFDNLDKALDGWLIKSENYQALNTILPKFREGVKCIYIDPPYNSESTEIDYINRYKHSSWMSLMENRLNIARDFLNEQGIICVAIDDNELLQLRQVVSIYFPEELGFAVVRSNPAGRSTPKGFSLNHEYVAFFAKTEAVTAGRLQRTKAQRERYREVDEYGSFEWVNFRKHGGLKEEAPRMYYPIYVSNIGKWRLPRMKWDQNKKEWIVLEKPKEDEKVLWPIDKNGQPRRWKWTPERLEQSPDEVKVGRDRYGQLSIYIKSRMREGITPPTWWDKSEYSATDYGTRTLKNLFGRHGIFTYPKAVALVEDCIRVGSGNDTYSIILDFFAGSGTTAHAVINLNRQDGGSRKYILIEMADYFYTVLLPRIKKVIFSDKWKDGKALPNGQGVSHFLKYYELEQYENVLRQARYSDEAKFFNDYNDPVRYIFMRDLKMAHALEVDLEQGKVKVDLSKLYSDIDLAETLSNLTGKWIKHIHPDPEDPTRPGTVEFEDGTKMDLKNPDWRVIKPLIWW
ncbi:MAG: site-specific DNA-methyltransferase [Thermotogae bacterium]|nr:site-specific DNA-methyltransferase [Thermotogota bacterium]